jgi:hypothetical protein
MEKSDHNASSADFIKQKIPMTPAVSLRSKKYPKLLPHIPMFAVLVLICSCIVASSAQDKEIHVALGNSLKGNIGSLQFSSVSIGCSSPDVI